jgi:hypothetical protein
MNDANGGNGERKIGSLRDMPQAIQPPRELWAGIEARIGAERESRDAGADDDKDVHKARPLPKARPMPARWLALAATIAALAVGVWIGRSSLPTPGSNPNTPTTAQSGNNTVTNESARALQAAYTSDPRYQEDRAALMKNLQAKLDSLPPDARSKVLSSLATIRQSQQDLEAALGKDPTNALLQELLLNTYQDEMRVLTTVHEASDAGKGI